MSVIVVLSVVVVLQQGLLWFVATNAARNSVDLLARVEKLESDSQNHYQNSKDIISVLRGR